MTVPDKQRSLLVPLWCHQQAEPDKSDPTRPNETE